MWFGGAVEAFNLCTKNYMLQELKTFDHINFQYIRLMGKSNSCYLCQGVVQTDPNTL